MHNYFNGPKKAIQL